MSLDLNQHRKMIASGAMLALLLFGTAPVLSAERKSPLIFSPAGGVYATNVPVKISADTKITPPIFAGMGFLPCCAPLSNVAFHAFARPLFAP